MLEKIIKKDKNEELEKVLEEKMIDEQAKNLLQGILYKIEVSYKDYKKVKVINESEKKYVEQLILNIKKNCKSIKVIKLSQKIEDDEERKRLISLTKEILPENMGAIIRTSAVGKTKDDLERDLKELIKKWNDIINIKFDKQDFPKLISKSNEMIDKLLLDLIDKDLKIIHVDTEEMKSIVENKVKLLDKDDIQIICDIENVMLKYNIQHQLDVAENRKIWLKSGGFITIDKTEALTAIDVNSAKFTGKVDLENTAFLINKEAAIEIEKQIRLRDIGGIIIIDFIDLKDDKHKKELINLFSDELKKERTRVQIEGFTKLNLLELTRKHIYSE